MEYLKIIGRFHHDVVVRRKGRLSIIFGIYEVGRVKHEELLWVSGLDESESSVEAKLAGYKEKIKDGPVDLTRVKVA